MNKDYFDWQGTDTEAEPCVFVDVVFDELEPGALKIWNDELHNRLEYTWVNFLSGVI